MNKIALALPKHICLHLVGIRETPTYNSHPQYGPNKFMAS